MCVPEKKHLSRNEPEGRVRAVLAPGKDSILWGREQHQGQAGASSTQQQDKSGGFLGFVLCETYKRF